MTKPGEGTTRPMVLLQVTELLVQRREALDVQIRAMQGALRGEMLAPSDDAVLALYLVLPSARDVVRVANELGWRLPGAKGNLRQYATNYIYEMLRGQGEGLNEALFGMAREKLDARYAAQWGPNTKPWQGTTG